MTQEERKAIVLAFIQDCFGKQDPASLVGYHEQRWPEEKLSAGCVNGTRPGALTAKVSAADGRMVSAGQSLFDDACIFDSVAASERGVQFAGTESAVVWRGYMEGAIESGERAAARIMSSMGLSTQQFEPPTPAPVPIIRFVRALDLIVAVFSIGMALYLWGVPAPTLISVSVIVAISFVVYGLPM